jgi:hypothetical protein
MSMDKPENLPKNTSNSILILIVLAVILFCWHVLPVISAKINWQIYSYQVKKLNSTIESELSGGLPGIDSMSYYQSDEFVHSRNEKIEIIYGYTWMVVDETATIFINMAEEFDSLSLEDQCRTLVIIREALREKLEDICRNESGNLEVKLEAYPYKQSKSELSIGSFHIPAADIRDYKMTPNNRVKTRWIPDVCIRTPEHRYEAGSRLWCKIDGEVRKTKELLSQEYEEERKRQEYQYEQQALERRQRERWYQSGKTGSGSSSGGKSSGYSSGSSSSKNSNSSGQDAYDDGYEDVYENDDYDWDRYRRDSSYAAGVDDAMEDIGEAG